MIFAAWHWLRRQNSLPKNLHALTVFYYCHYRFDNDDDEKDNNKENDNNNAHYNDNNDDNDNKNANTNNTDKNNNNKNNNHDQYHAEWINKGINEWFDHCTTELDLP